MTCRATQISLWRKAIAAAPIRSLVTASSRHYGLQTGHLKRNAACSFSTAGSIILQHRPEREKETRREEMVDRMLHRTSFTLNSAVGVASDLDEPFVLVVLNHDIPKFVPVLWNQARLRICADGGANRLYDELPSMLTEEQPEEVRQRYRPDVIKGDLDSIRPTVREFYKNLGVKIIDESHDQDSTDFQKCISYIRNPDYGCDHWKVVVVGALGGRFDHVVAHINVLYKHPKLRITLLSDESLLYLLPQGFSHEIQINSAVEGPHCGLIPFGKASESTTTTGLRWNLNGSAMAFGSMISTSNLLDGDVVTVASDCPLIWTVAVRPV
ncbi:hypothetical protein R1sor_003836 [Riccia sorocarpa]|uniref:thiamine diphosphokinase n=1 Tax=Riccia sorocarpa TaxID=122646 RepID=A0ABD3H5M2_9MARC